MNDVMNATDMQSIGPRPRRNDPLTATDMIGTYTQVFQDGFDHATVNIVANDTGSVLSSLGLRTDNEPTDWDTHNLEQVDDLVPAATFWTMGDMQTAYAWIFEVNGSTYLGIYYYVGGLGGDPTETGVWLGVSPPPSDPPCTEPPPRRSLI